MFMFNQKLVTIFSAPNYCNRFQNSAGILTVNIKEGELECGLMLMKPINRKHQFQQKTLRQRPDSPDTREILIKQALETKLERLKTELRKCGQGQCERVNKDNIDQRESESKRVLTPLLFEEQELLICNEQRSQGDQASCKEQDNENSIIKQQQKEADEQKLLRIDQKVKNTEKCKKDFLAKDQKEEEGSEMDIQREDQQSCSIQS